MLSCLRMLSLKSIKEKITVNNVSQVVFGNMNKYFLQ